MKRLSIATLAAFLTLAAVGIAGAATPSRGDAGQRIEQRRAHPRIDRRQAFQRQRIRHGVRSGALTRGEAQRLRHGERMIARGERRACRDGVITPRERVRIERMQDRMNRRIHRLRHNGRSV